MKNRSTMISMLLATGSIVAFVVILGNLENPSSSLPQSTHQSIVSPKGQSEAVNPGFSYEYDFDDDENGKEVNERSDRGHGKGKRYGKSNQLLPSAGTASASNDNSTSNSTPNTSSDSAPIQPNPRQSTTQAS